MTRPYKLHLYLWNLHHMTVFNLLLPTCTFEAHGLCTKTGIIVPIFLNCHVYITATQKSFDLKVHTTHSYFYFSQIHLIEHHRQVSYNRENGWNT